MLYRFFIVPYFFRLWANCTLVEMNVSGGSQLKHFWYWQKINNLIWINFVSKIIEMGWFNSRRDKTLLDISWKTQTVLQKVWFLETTRWQQQLVFWKKIGYINQIFGCPIYPKIFLQEHWNHDLSNFHCPILFCYTLVCFAPKIRMAR